MYAINEQYESQNNRLKQVIATSINKLETYKKERNELPQDTDGIYIVLRGECKVVNPVDKELSKICKLAKNDNFGGSKFLKEQSYSYFGDVIACNESSEREKSPDRRKSEKRSMKTADE